MSILVGKKWGCYLLVRAKDEEREKERGRDTMTRKETDRDCEEMTR